VLNNLNAATAPHPLVIDMWKAVTDALQPTVWRVLAALVAFVAVVQRQFRVAIIVVIAVGGAALLSTIVKNAVARPRPVPPIPIQHVAGWSFPSGHAMAAASVAAVLIAVVSWPRGRNRNVAVSIVVLLVAAVATSRLALGVHYLTDVVGGLALGVCWSSMVVVVVFAIRLPHREQNQRRDTGGDAIDAERPQ
jgi:undecaprenyl-diphosphatase